MTPITCYQTDETGRYLHKVTAYPFPMEDRLNVPFLAVQVEPPAIPDGYFARWLSPHQPVAAGYDIDGEWSLEEIPPVPEPVVDEEAQSEEESPAQA